VCAAEVRLTAEHLHLPAGSTADGDDPLLVTPERAGWSYCGLRIVRLAPGSVRELATGSEEMAVLPLSGGAVVEVAGRRFELAGRTSVFARVSDFAYLPIDAEVRLSSRGGAELALASARAERRFDAVHVPVPGCVHDEGSEEDDPGVPDTAGDPLRALRQDLQPRSHRQRLRGSDHAAGA